MLYKSQSWESSTQASLDSVSVFQGCLRYGGMRMALGKCDLVTSEEWDQVLRLDGQESRTLLRKPQLQLTGPVEREAQVRAKR